MVGLLLLLALHAIVGRQVPSSEHFSQVVQVAVEEKEEDGEVRVVVGNLKLHLGRRAGEHLLGRVLVQEVPGQPGLVNISSLSVCLSGSPRGQASARRVFVRRRSGRRTRVRGARLHRGKPGEQNAVTAGIINQLSPE